MKKISIIFSFIFCLSFFSCEKEGSDECRDVPIPEDFVNPRKYYLLAHGVGDTLIFKKFRKNEKGGEYTYIGEEMFIGADSSVQKTLTVRYMADVCHDEVYLHEIHNSFSGPKKLDLSLFPIGDVAKLRVLFAEKEFQMSSTQEGKNSIQELQVGDTTYYEVDYMRGYKEGAWGDGRNYVDSTYCFYTLNRGIVQFIINDTLKYERVHR